MPLGVFIGLRVGRPSCNSRICHQSLNTLSCFGPRASGPANLIGLLVVQVKVRASLQSGGIPYPYRVDQSVILKLDIGVTCVEIHIDQCVETVSLHTCLLHNDYALIVEGVNDLPAAWEVICNLYAVRYSPWFTDDAIAIIDGTYDIGFTRQLRHTTHSSHI